MSSTGFNIHLYNLAEYCSEGDTINANLMLKQISEVDLFNYNQGFIIKEAIKQGMTDFLDNLIKYQRKNKVDIHEKGTSEYNMSLLVFKNTLDMIIDSFWDYEEKKYNFSPQVQEVLETYHDFGEECDLTNISNEFNENSDSDISNFCDSANLSRDSTPPPIEEAGNIIRFSDNV